MKQNFNFSLEKVLEWEGLWSDHPSDSGGATMKGITIGTYREYKRNQYITKEQLHAISNEEVADIYKKRYWDVVRGDDMPTGIDFLLFDFAVNAGPGRATKIMQDCLGVAADGVIGPKTMAEVQKADKRDLIKKYSDAKEQYYRTCKNKNGELLFPIFGKGWMRRLESNESLALTMIG